MASILFGLLFLWVGYSNQLWSVFGMIFEKEDKWSDFRLGITIVRFILLVIGALILLFSVPNIMHGVSNPGWTIIGGLFFTVCQLPWFWGQFDPLVYRYDDKNKVDENWAGAFVIVRTIGSIIGIASLGIGIGTGCPSWEVVTADGTCNPQMVQTAPAETAPTETPPQQ